MVGKCGVDSNYFWDEMPMREVSILIKGYNEDYIDGWEKVRLLRNVIYSSMGVKADKLKFSWDEEEIIQTKTYKKIEMDAEIQKKLLGIVKN